MYIVHDRACDRVCPNRAQASLPRNLTLKPSQNQVNNVSYSFELSQYMSRFRVFCISSCTNIIRVSLSTHIGRKLTDVSSSILFIVIWFRNWRLLTFWLLERWFNSNCYSLKKKLSIKRQDLVSFFKKGIMLIWLFCCFWKIWNLKILSNL